MTTRSTTQTTTALEQLKKANCSKPNITKDSAMNYQRLFLGFLTATVVIATGASVKPASASEQSNNQLMAQALQPGAKPVLRNSTSYTVVMNRSRSSSPQPGHHAAPAPLPRNFFTLHPDAAYRVFEHLSGRDLARLKQTSRAMNTLVRDYEAHQMNKFIADFSRLTISNQ